MLEEAYKRRTKKSKALSQTAQEVIPLGVNSTFRFFDPYPLYVDRTEGTKITDVDGNEYIDFSMNYGAQLVGHTHPKIIQALKKQTGRGTLYTMPHELSTQFAEEIIKRFPVDKVRFTNSGTETTMHAVRLARGYTGRDKIIKFAGAYHGVHDYVLASLLPSKNQEIADEPIPISKGIPVDTLKNTLIATFNDLESVKNLFNKHKGEIAAVIIEPVLMNIGIILPEDDFLKKLKDICQEEGALLIFDEVKTGVKVAWGGACEYYNIKPDIVCLAKSIGGGLPIGAFGARDEIISEIRMEDGVKHAGTYNANPLAIAVGVVTLKDILTKNVYEEIFSLNKKLVNGYNHIIREHNLPAQTSYIGACGTIYFCREPVKPIENHKDFLMVDEEMAERYWLGMLNEGIIPHPRGLCDEQWTISVQHTEKDVNKHLQAFEKVALGLKEGYKSKIR